MKKVQVFVGAQKDQRIVFDLLKESIEINAGLIECTVHDLSDFVGDIVADRTPFSLQRFYIPAVVDKDSDYAIYLDSDMYVFRAISELLDYADLSDSSIVGVSQPDFSLRGSQSSVIVFKGSSFSYKVEDVEAILSNYRCGRITYSELFVDLAPFGLIDYSIAPSWNSLEYYDDGTTGLLHYTDMETQPWLSSVSPLSPAWEALLKESKSLDLELVKSHIKRGLVKPSLLCRGRLVYLKELFWYPPGNIPSNRPWLWALLRFPMIGPLACFLLRVIKATRSPRERIVLFLLIKLVITGKRVKGNQGLFESYE